jgi:alkaline phosphatase D
MKLYILSLLALVSIASASWSKNLNYRSPSEHHPSLGVSIHRVVKRNDPSSNYDAAALNFTHGVASGDPYPTSVILWTRVAPASDNSNSNVTVSGYAPLFDHDNEKYVSVSKSPICVEYKVASDKEMGNVVDSGKVYTSSDVDYTVKVRIDISLLCVESIVLTLLRLKRGTWKHTRHITTSLLYATLTTRVPLVAQRPLPMPMTMLPKSA